MAVVAAAISLGIASSAVSAPVAPTALSASKTRLPAPQNNPWLTLSAMTAATSSASAVAATQGEEMAVGWPHIAPLSAILGTIATAIYIALEQQDNRDGSTIVRGMGLRPAPLSPA